jgi:Zn-dependent protease
MNFFFNYALEDPQYFFSWIIAISFSICVHEWAHAYTALKCGDDTAEKEGHITLNPLVQMGPMSILFLLLVGLAWGAVPVDVSQLRQRWHQAWVAFAGPLSNLVLSFLFGLITVVAVRVGSEGNQMYEFFELAARANALLFILNMMPVPALDGWQIYAHWIPAMKWMRRETANTFSNIFLILIFVSPLMWQLWRGADWLAGGFILFWSSIAGLIL